MKQRLITAIAIIAVVLPILILGGIPFYVLASAVMIMVNYESTRLVNKNWPAAFTNSLYPITLAGIYCAYRGLEFVVLYLVFLTMYLFCWQIFCEKVDVTEIGIVLMIQLIVIMMVAGMFLMYQKDNWLIFMVILGGALCDTFAYFTGRAFGRHKLNERISPKKTIEGSIGGWLAGAIAVALVGFLVLIPKGVVSPLFTVILALTLPLVSQIGDLAFSALKRHYGIKDFSNVFPGHGGVLDRLDSLSFAFMWTYALMVILL